MKKLYILSLFACVSLLSHAQVGDYRREVAVGGYAGVNMSNVSFNPTIKQASLTGPNIGAALRYTCEKYFTCICAIQIECNYAQLGWKEVIDDNSGNTYQRKLNYVQVPLLARLGWGRERKGAQGYILLGPQMGFLLSSKEVKGGGEWFTGNRPNGVTYQYDVDLDKKFDYGIAAGAGMELSNKLGHFLVEARYYYGLGDIFDNSKTGHFGRSGNSAITVRLGYFFDIMRSKNPTIK